MFWGILWLVATLGGPIALLLLSFSLGEFLWCGGATLVLHIVSTRMIVRVDAMGGERTDSGRLSNWLIFGGWALMIGVFFAGCVSDFEIGL